MNDTWRKDIAHDHSYTYAATVLHIMNGLRKLARVNEFGEAGTATETESVFRAVRGELPKSFWLLDDFGMVTATDFALMSTSTDVNVCQEFMATEQSNVLWEVKCGAETATGLHSGADVSLVSQFAQEQEKLFPPLTMLKVESIQVEEAGEGEGRIRKGSVLNRVEGETTKGAKYVHIVVIPTFV